MIDHADRQPRIDIAPDDMSYDADRLRQLEMGLRLTPAERLRWLEETVEELRPLLGLARAAGRVGK